MLRHAEYPLDEVHISYVYHRRDDPAQMTLGTAQKPAVDSQSMICFKSYSSSQTLAAKLLFAPFS